MKQKYKITFGLQSVGSARYALITKNKTGCFDLDYDLILQHFPKEFSGRRLKDIIRSELDEIAVRHSFKHGEDSHSAITYKSTRQPLSFDLAVLQTAEAGYLRIIHDKASVNALWNELRDLTFLHRTSKQLRQDRHWNEVRNRYLAEKQTSKMPSFVLLFQIVNELPGKYIAKENNKMSKHTVSGNTHAQPQLNHHANQCNPNNAAHHAAQNNHANQCNPNHKASK